MAKRYSYDKKYEIDRKRALERLAKRTQEEVEAEEQNEVLTAEKARIKQNEEILARERDHVEQLLAQIRASRTGPEPKVSSNNPWVIRGACTNSKKEKHGKREVLMLFR